MTGGQVEHGAVLTSRIRVRQLRSDDPVLSDRDDVYRELVLSSTAIHDHLLCVPPDQFEEHLYLANRIADLLSRHCPFPHCDLPALLASARRIREGLSQYWVDEELPGETCQLRWWGR